MNDVHEPDPVFLDRLQWQVMTEARRRVRFGATQPQTRPARFRGRTLALLVLACIACTSVGAVGAAAVTSRIGSDVELERLRAHTRLELAVTAEELSSADLEETRLLHEEGYVGAHELLEHEARVLEMRTERRLAESELREIEARRGAVDDTIGARTVRGTDYVGERLRIRLELAVAKLEVEKHGFERVKALEEAGAISTTEIAMWYASVAEAERDVRSLEKHIELRRAVVDGTMLPKDAELRARRADLRADLEFQAGAVERAKSSIEMARELVAAGVASSRGMREAEMHLHAAEGELRLIEAELRVIDRMLAER